MGWTNFPRCAFLAVLMMTVLMITGCRTGGDIVSQQNAHEAKDTIYKYLDPNLPESAKKAAKLQADRWAEYEDQKFK